MNEQMETPVMPANGYTNKPKKQPWWLLIVAVVVIAAVVAVALILAKPKAPEPETSETSATVSVSEMRVEDVTPTQKKVACPIDFAALQARNSDLYAWITMPNTVIDYPIAQSAPDEEEDFYLHRGEDKEYLFEGTIYTQKLNKKDFSDPNTIIYGHCMKNGTMFRALHDLKVQSMWDSTKEFYIYTATGHKLTYRIFSAYTRDSKHILRQNNYFKTKQDYADYLDEVQHPAYGMTRNCNVTTKDRIVTLETCVTANGNTRFVVSGVLVKDEPTYYKAN